VLNFQEVPIWNRKFLYSTLRGVTCHHSTRRTAPQGRRALLKLPINGPLAADMAGMKITLRVGLPLPIPAGLLQQFHCQHTEQDGRGNHPPMGQHHGDQQDGMTGPEKQDGGKPVGPFHPGVVAISEILTGLFEFLAILGKARVLRKTASYIRCLQGKEVIVETGKWDRT